MENFDQKTAEYFNTVRPRYNTARLDFFSDFYAQNSHEISKVLDIGSGDGDSVKVLSEKLPGIDFHISDIAHEYMDRAGDLTKIVGSILDSSFVSGLNDYQAVQCVSLLHHLVDGRSRGKSVDNVRTAIGNMAKIAGKDGYVLIFEPVWSPEIVGFSAFYIKNLFSKFVSKRIEFTPNSIWNIGQPVVSYLSQTMLERIFDDVGLRIVKRAVFQDSTFAGFMNCKRMQYVLQPSRH